MKRKSVGEAAVLFVTLAGLSTVSGAVEVFFATATPTQEMHRPSPPDTQASCVATFRLLDASRLSYRIHCYNLNRITMSHIHFGNADINGGIRFSLFQGEPNDVPTNGPLASGVIVAGSAAVSAGLFNQTIFDMRNDNTYFNVHTADSPNGEARGQVVRLDLPSESIFLY